MKYSSIHFFFKKCGWQERRNAKEARVRGEVCTVMTRPKGETFRTMNLTSMGQFYRRQADQAWHILLLLRNFYARKRL